MMAATSRGHSVGFGSRRWPLDGISCRQAVLAVQRQSCRVTALLLLAARSWSKGTTWRWVPHASQWLRHGAMS